MLTNSANLWKLLWEQNLARFKLTPDENNDIQQLGINPTVLLIKPATNVGWQVLQFASQLITPLSR